MKNPIAMRVKLLQIGSMKGLSNQTELMITEIIHNISESCREQKAEEILHLVETLTEEELVEELKKIQN